MEKVLREVDRIDANGYLYLEDIKFVRYEVFGRKVVFLYEDTPQFNHALFRFLNKKTKVEPQAYNSAVREVLRVIREAVKKGGAL